MDKSIKNLLYGQPALYEVINHQDNSGLVKRIFEQYQPTQPTSILDIGCGTGRDLYELSKSYPTCVGVDYLESMISYAKKQYPDVHFQQGDMRSLRLEQTFDAIISFGWVITFALTEADLRKSLQTFKVHAHSGTLLVLELLNAAALLGKLDIRPEFEINEPDFKAHAKASYRLLRREQLVVRERIWQVEGSDTPIEDFCKYRLLFPAELTYLLNEHGYQVLDMFDNRDLEPSDLSGELLYVIAKFNNA